MFDAFQFEPQVSISDGEFVVRLPDLNLIASGASYDGALAELTEIARDRSALVAARDVILTRMTTAERVVVCHWCKARFGAQHVHPCDPETLVSRVDVLDEIDGTLMAEAQGLYERGDEERAGIAFRKALLGIRVIQSDAEPFESLEALGELSRGPASEPVSQLVAALTRWEVDEDDRDCASLVFDDLQDDPPELASLDEGCLRVLAMVNDLRELHKPPWAVLREITEAATEHFEFFDQISDDPYRYWAELVAFVAARVREINQR